jgi:hypothetical protein
MPQSVPTPVAAALGLVPTVLGGVRRLPGRALQLPVLAVGSTLSRLDAARREYDDLAARGERLIARLRGTSFDEVEDRVEDALQGTPLARPYDAVEDALEDAGAAVAGTVSTLSGRLAKKADAGQDRPPADEQPKGAPTPAATQPDDTRIDTAAAPSVVRTVEKVSAQVGATAVLDHDDLPLPDYDHMTLGSLRGRLRSLTVEQLVQVRTYEKAHADRLPVVTMLDNRIAKLATDSGGTQPSGVPSERPAPGQRASRGGSKVSQSGPSPTSPPDGIPGEAAPVRA